MPPIPRRTLLLAAATPLALLSVGCAEGSIIVNQGVVVSVANTGTAPLSAVEVRYTGGTVRVPALAPGAAHHSRIAPTSESHLDLAFTDATGRRHTREIGVFFEPGYTGSVAITVDDAGGVAWRDRIRP